jgi:peptidyl-prolyl cis-trans isomerase A (cyclophilin A)
MTRLILAFAAVAVLIPATSSAQKVEITTNKGVIIVELDAKKAPLTVKNFLMYVDKGFYAGTIFHRVIKKFMIQGGGFDRDMTKKPTEPPIALESGKGLSNKRGTLAMARTQVKNSATAQFFINHVDNARLDSMGGGYAVFGKVIRGIEIVDAIADVATGQKGGMGNVPTEPIIIEKITRISTPKTK